MRYENMVVLVGNVGSDPEMRTTAGTGHTITKFSMATNRRTEAATPDWHRIVCWAGLAQAVAEHVKKGDRVYVKGRIEYSQSGAGDDRKYWTDIVAEEVIFLGGGGRDA